MEQLYHVVENLAYYSILGVSGVSVTTHYVSKIKARYDVKTADDEELAIIEQELEEYRQELDRLTRERGFHRQQFEESISILLEHLTTKNFCQNLKKLNAIRTPQSNSRASKKS